jgi:hypothetical protein
MNTFLAIFTGSPQAMDEWKSLDPAQREAREKAGMEAWKAWVEKHQASIVDHGAPLGKTKRISAAGISDIRNDMGAYTVVRAESHEDAAKLFEQHPHFTIFPGDAVEVMQCLPMPGN